MNSCVNLNIKNMRKVKEKQKKIVSQQNKTKQLKTNQYNERRGEETGGEERRQEGNHSTSLCVFVLIPHLYTCFIFICITIH